MEVVQRKQNGTAWLFAFKDKSNQVPSLANKKWTKVINPLWSRAVKTESLQFQEIAGHMTPSHTGLVMSR